MPPHRRANAFDYCFENHTDENYVNRVHDTQQIYNEILCSIIKTIIWYYAAVLDLKLRSFISAV